jgi:tetratricopeptide (TPR) repeat protein
LAEALRLKAESDETRSSERRGLLSDSRDAYRLVASVPNEFQSQARAAVAALGPGNGSERAVPRDFAAAYEAGKDAMASVNAAKMALPSAVKNNPAAIPELRTQMDESKNEARRNFRLALALVDEDTDRDQLNEVRYFLCWLYWEGGEYFQAAVLGDFLARRYPEHPAAAAAAKLALASYEQLQQAASHAPAAPQDGEFEARKMAEIAQFMTRRWPNTQAAETAFRVLASYAIRTDRINDAKSLLGQVSASSRPALEGQLGNAMWGRYLELSAQRDKTQLDDARLQKLREDAIEFLKRGFAAARQSGSTTEVSATSGLYLVQALLGAGEHAEAIRLLEERKVGPLSLVLEESESAARPEYQVEVYKAALRAYVSVTPPQIQKAIDMMQRLERTTSASGNVRREQLTSIYVSLAVSLNEQLERLRGEGRDAEAARVRSAFGEFLEHLSRVGEATDWPTRYWIAHAYFTMGESLQTQRAAGSTPTPGAAKKYFTRARDSFHQLLADAQKDPKLPPSPTAALAVKRQLGECYRALGEYQQALDMFSAVLAGQESQLLVQQAAARTYQDWGATSGDTKRLERAIFGGYKLRSTGKNRIWGWLKLALVAERAARAKPSYTDVFFESRLEAARCRYLIGTKTQGPAREQHFATAKQSIRSMLQLYPELGGDRWRGQFERLLKEIQTASGEQPAGLREFAAARS